jgi:hypothetical protein
MNTYGGSGCIDPPFLELGSSWSKWSALRPGPFIPGTQWIGGWVGARAGLNDMDKWKFLTLPGLEFRPLGRQPVASRYTDWAIPTLSLM